VRFELVAAILGSPHGFDVILVRNAVCFLLECLAGEPSAMTQRPVLAGFVRATVAQEKSEKLLASPHQLHHGVDPGAQVAADPIERVGDHIRRQDRVHGSRIKPAIAEALDLHAEELRGGNCDRRSRRLVLGHFQAQTAIGGLGGQKPAQGPILPVRMPEQRARDGEPGQQSKVIGAFLGRAERLASQTRRSEESEHFQQFSTPLALGFVVAEAAALTPSDVVLEPSAGTGLLAIFAELAKAQRALNEIADTRAGLLGRLFRDVAVTRHNAEQIHDHLDAAIRPSVVLMNPPFSASPYVAGRFAEATMRHIGSALARLAEGGRLVAITGRNVGPEQRREAFVRFQEKSRVVFTATIAGKAYVRQGRPSTACVSMIASMTRVSQAARLSLRITATSSKSAR
jgi:hypothetical protein